MFCQPLLSLRLLDPLYVVQNTLGCELGPAELEDKEPDGSSSSSSRRMRVESEKSLSYFDDLIASDFPG